jgi:hypothetical protein
MNDFDFLLAVDHDVIDNLLVGTSIITKIRDEEKIPYYGYGKNPNKDIQSAGCICHVKREGRSYTVIGEPRARAGCQTITICRTE